MMHIMMLLINLNIWHLYLCLAISKNTTATPWRISARMDDFTEPRRQVDARNKARADDRYWKNVIYGIFPEVEAFWLPVSIEKPTLKKRGCTRTRTLPILTSLRK